MEKGVLIQKYNKQANKYDRQREKQSKNKWRKEIFQSVRGKTLEVAVGAGMNFPFFPPSIEYTGVDFSPDMLEKAKEAAKRHHLKAEFILSEVENLPFSENTFDTILSSGTLCSYEDPIKVLNLFNKWCKKDGQILLKEHGLFENQAMAWLQHRLDPLSVKVYGCHLNRDIHRLVELSDLEIVKSERGIFGYLHLIWARPKQE